MSEDAAGGPFGEFDFGFEFRRASDNAQNAPRLAGAETTITLMEEGSVRHVFSPSFAKKLRTDPSGPSRSLSEMIAHTWRTSLIRLILRADSISSAAIEIGSRERIACCSFLALSRYR